MVVVGKRVMVAGGDYRFTGLRRKKCDFVDDLGLEKRGREGFVFVCDFDGWG